jgi:hypothetical protein
MAGDRGRWGLPLLCGGLLLRLVLALVVLPGEGMSGDLRLFARWATTMAKDGPGAFFANAGFTEYPPVYLYVLWPLGFAGKVLAAVSGQPSLQATIALIKLPAIVADLLLAWLIQREAAARSGRRAGLVAAALFLFVPFTWYDSAVFGQVDSVGVVFVVLALILLTRGWSEPAAAMLVLATMTKPQYGIFVAVLVPVLVRRHLLRPGSGPVPRLHAGGHLDRLDRRLGGWFTRSQGPRRLAASAVTATVVAALVLAPFDIWRRAPAPLSGLPLVDHVRGLGALVSEAAAHYTVLTANAFNPWAIVGPTPLTRGMSPRLVWTEDSLLVAGPASAFMVGAALLLGLVALVAWRLLRRDDWSTIVSAFGLLALGFFVLPTRVHERYQFPVFAIVAFLAATSMPWRWWTAALAVLGSINLHAVVTLAVDDFATPALVGAALGDIVRSEPVIAFVGLGNGLLFALALAVWLRNGRRGEDGLATP